MADNGGLGPFAPYVKQLNEDDPFMKRVPMKRMDIASNDTAMPSMSGETGKIEHVGGSKGR